MKQLPLVLAHRGVSAHAFENTLDAFRLALELRVDGVELDVRETCDSRFVVHHDADVPGGLVASQSLAALRGGAAKRGGRIPSLRDALELLAAGGSDFVVFLEVKAMRSWDALRRELAPWRGRLDLEVQSFLPAVLDAAAAASEGWPRGVIARTAEREPVAPLRRCGARTLSLLHEAVTPHVVDAVHAEGLRLAAWTIDAPARARTLAALGVDALVSNDPGPVRDALRETREDEEPRASRPTAP